MHGLVIARHGNDDVVKVSTSKEKLLVIAEAEIRSYLKKNKNLKKSAALSALMDALSIGEIEDAMDLFGEVSEKNGEAIFLVLMNAEIIYDA